MAITEQNISRIGDLVTIEVTSNLTPPVHFHWYVDGVPVAETSAGSYTFHVPLGDQVRVEILDTTDPDFDALANAPDGYPARRELFWVRNTDAAVQHYRIEQQQDGGDWTILARVWQRPGVWEQRCRTERLTDLSTYSWRIVPVDTAGNDGTVLTIGPEKIVRTPDAPDFTVAFDDGTQKVTFAAA